MKLDAELALDDLSQASSGPQFGGEAEGFGAFAEPVEDKSFLSPVEFAWSACLRLGVQACIAFFLIPLPPFAYGAHIDIEKIGDPLLSVAFAEPVDGEPPPSLQLLGRTSCSHAQLYA